jgi:hypothetical protein
MAVSCSRLDIEQARAAMRYLECSPSGELVCHYTKPSTARLILGAGTLRLGQMRWTNDPWETRERRFEGSDSVGWSSPDDADEPAAAFDRRFRDLVRVACATLDTYSKASRIVQRGFGRPRMWAQYAENHSGACLVFNRDLLEATMMREVGARGQVFSGEVDYDPISMSAGGTALDVEYDQFKALGEQQLWEHQVERYKEALFFRKHEDWQAESEWRFVVVDRSPSSNHLDCRFGDALMAVVLGCNVTESDSTAISESAQVPTLRLRLSGDDFILNHLGPPISLSELFADTPATQPVSPRSQSC